MTSPCQETPPPLRDNATIRHEGGMPVRLNLWLADDLVEKLDAWRRAQRNPPTRAAALKELAQQRLDGMDARELEPVPPPRKPSHPKGKPKT